MNNELKQNWINALRSGKYKQAKLAYRTNEGFCVWGVLLEVTGHITWEQCNDKYCAYPRLGSLGIQKQFDISREEYEKLLNWNDNGQCNFNELANYIEEHL